MKKHVITIFLLLFTEFLFAQDDIFKAAWLTEPVKVDGKAEEWSQPLRYYDSETKLSFAFANNDKNLYLCFQTTDNTNRIKIMKAGMEVSLNIKGEHKATIDFPLEQHIDSTQRNNATPQNEHGSNERNHFPVQNMMLIHGFATRNGMIAIDDSSGINAAINHNGTDKFTYEIVIPIKELFGFNYTAKDITRHISMEVKINAMKDMGHPANNNFSERAGNGRMGEGGGHMGGSGGMHHSRNTNNNNEEANIDQIKEDRTDLSKKAEFKQKFILAQNGNIQ